MKDFFEKNKIPIAIIIAAFIIAGSIWLSNRPASTTLPSGSDRGLTPRLPKTAELAQQPPKRISYTEAPNHVGEYACVVGRVDHVYPPKKAIPF
jgi:hypothetical protein